MISNSCEEIHVQDVMIMLRVFKKRQRIIAIALGFSVLALIVIAIYGVRYLAAVDFLIDKNQIAVQELFRTLKFLVIAFMLAICNYSVIFVIWLLSERGSVKTLKSHLPSSSRSTRTN